LRTAGVADEMMASALVGVCYCGVYDLDELISEGHGFDHPKLQTQELVRQGRLQKLQKQIP